MSLKRNKSPVKEQLYLDGKKKNIVKENYMSMSLMKIHAKTP